MIGLNFEVSTLEKFTGALNLLGRMTRLAGITAYANISQIGPHQATLDIGRWLHEQRAIDLGRTRSYLDGGSRAPMIARLKSGELVVYQATAGAAATPLVKRADRGSDWQGGVGDVEWAVGVSGLAQQIDKLLAAIVLYSLVYDGFELVSLRITPETEDDYQSLYALHGGAQGPVLENRFVFCKDEVEIAVLRPNAGQAPICMWGFRGPNASALLAFLEELMGENFLEGSTDYMVLGERRSDEMYDFFGAYQVN